MDDASAQRIAQLEADLAAARREMQDFTYTVSHDLRAPLRHIISYARLAQEDAGPQLGTEVQGFLATVTDSARNLGAMLDALLELSRIGTVALDVEPVPLQAMVEDVAQSLRNAHPQRAIDWRIALDACSVPGDASLLRQALMCVLDNAVKFTAPHAQAVIEVSAHADTAAQCVVIAIRDDGVGFNPVLQDKLFQPFHRLHSSSQFSGLGLGLAQVRKIVLRHGGQVAIAASMDGGCTVTLTLPLA
jgi:signal transduction histidine kinase